MFDNSNFAGEKGMRYTKWLAYGLFCYVEINIKKCILSSELLVRGIKALNAPIVQCWL